MNISDGNKVIGFKVLKYKGIIFDEWTKDENRYWAMICPNCLKQYEDRIDLEIDSSGTGCCSVRGCWQDDDNEIDMKYLDFDINGVEIIEETLEELIDKLKEREMTLDGISHEIEYRENTDDKGPGGWDDTLYEYTTEELEVIEKVWDDYK